MIRKNKSKIKPGIFQEQVTVNNYQVYEIVNKRNDTSLQCNTESMRVTN